MDSSFKEEALIQLLTLSNPVTLEYQYETFRE